MKNWESAGVETECRNRCFDTFVEASLETVCQHATDSRLRKLQVNKRLASLEPI